MAVPSHCSCCGKSTTEAKIILAFGEKDTLICGECVKTANALITLVESKNYNVIPIATAKVMRIVSNRGT